MSLTLQIINPLHYEQWDDLLISTRNYSFFHSSIWARVLIGAYKYKPLYFALVDKGKLLVSMPFMEINSLITGRRGVSLPFSDSCEPIIDESIQCQDAIDYIISYAKRAGWKYIDIRGGLRFPEHLQPSSQYYMHTLDLSQDEEKIFSRLRPSMRRNVKRAAREGVKISISNSSHSMKEFYRLNCLTRKRHGLPPQPYRFFKKIYEHIISSNMGCVILASFRERNIAGAVYFHFGRLGIYKYGASDTRYLHLKPNNLVMWEAIKWHLHNGCESLCFGKTELENKGLREFKNGWRAKEETIKYYKYNVAKEMFITEHSKVRGLHNKVFEKMPIPLLKIAGYLLYKHAG